MAQVPESLWESQADPPAQAPIEYELVINLNIAAGAAPTYRRRCSSGTDGMIEIERLFAAVPESDSDAVDGSSTGTRVP